jgi:hypothetical protein
VKRKTVGKEAYDRMCKGDDNQGVIDTEREVNKDYYAEINKAINCHKDWTDPFYVVVLTKKERLMENVVRRYFIARKSLPTPQWDQTCWRFDPKSGDLRFIWCLPDENTAKWMAGNPTEIPTEQYQLLKFVLDMLDKKLYRRYLDMFHKDDVAEKTEAQKKVQLIL